VSPTQRTASRSRSAATLLIGFAACLSTVAPPPDVGYRNPLDFSDAGSDTDGGSLPDDGGANFSQGMVDGRRPNLTAAIYFVEAVDGGQPRTLLTLGDIADLCDATRGDGGDLGPSWDLVGLRLAGDIPGTYLVATALAPAGATAELQYQSDAGGFGIAEAVSGALELDAIDPGNSQTARGVYTLTFSATETLSGRFAAGPCTGISPPASGD